jgi:hypothetical protein
VINLATKCLFNLHKANLDQQKIAFNLIPGGWNTQNHPIFGVKSGHKNSNKPTAIIQLVFVSKKSILLQVIVMSMMMMMMKMLMQFFSSAEKMHHCS